MRTLRCLGPVAFVSSLALISGCSGKSVVGGGGAGGTGNSASPLAGDWEGIGTMLGRAPTSVRITVQPGIFKVMLSTGETLDAIASSDDYLVAYTPSFSSSSVFHATRTGAGMDVGDLPISIGGNWALTNGRNGCQASLAPTSATGMCSFISGLPSWARVFQNGLANGTRTSTRTSIFGELGGTWSFTGSGGAQCTMVFDGSSAQATCASPAWAMPSSVHIDFNGATASGGTSAGVEFSAHRL
jgi:hypothetical protein